MHGEEPTPEDQQIKIGIMLSDAGLGDQSFSDLGFAGLEKARDELNISFDYREIQDTRNICKRDRRASKIRKRFNYRTWIFHPRGP